MKKYLGIDIGGSGIKGAIVDMEKGAYASERVRIPTPSNSEPGKVAEIIGYIQEELMYEGPIGIGFPGAVINGKILGAMNLSSGWKNFEASTFFKEKLKCDKISVINDADAAAIAEMKFGDWPGDEKTLFLTIGTGIGSCLIQKGRVIYNTEFGHLKWKKKTTLEQYSADSVRKREKLSWKKWGKRFNKVLDHLNFTFTQPQFVIGGGIVKKEENFKEYIDDHIDWRCAKLGNSAGIIGAAVSLDIV